MNERLKSLRKELSLSQEAFGKRLGVTGTAISRIEIGNRAVTEQMILATCREFNVREEWLRDGSGEIFLDFTEDSLMTLLLEALLLNTGSWMKTASSCSVTSYIGCQTVCGGLNDCPRTVRSSFRPFDAISDT